MTRANSSVPPRTAANRSVRAACMLPRCSKWVGWPEGREGRPSFFCGPDHRDTYSAERDDLVLRLEVLGRRLPKTRDTTRQEAQLRWQLARYPDVVGNSAPPSDLDPKVPTSVSPKATNLTKRAP